MPLRLITEGCWTEPMADGWERRAKRAPCSRCQRTTRGVYFADVGFPTLYEVPVCAQCAVMGTGCGPVLVPEGDSGALAG
jgi:hypothetical protein